MKRSERKTIAAYFDDLFQVFMARFPEGSVGWGQFLDGPLANPQIGRYGTSAGAIVLGLSGNRDTQTAQRARETINTWLNPAPDDARGQDRLVQTLPLALLTLGIAYLAPGAQLLTDARARLFARQLHASRLWGDYWIDNARHAEQPSPFVSALVLLALYKSSQGPISPQIQEAARSLQTLYLRNPDQYIEITPLIQTAVVLSLGRGTHRATSKDLKHFGLSPVEISRRYNYFYDYQRPNETWGREYFIAPLEVFSILSLWCVNAPALAKLKARAAADVLMQRLDEGGGRLTLAPGDRHSTLEHGLAAMALDALNEFEKRPERLTVSRLSYELRRDHPAWRTLGSRLILVAYTLLAITNAINLLYGMKYAAWQQITVAAVAVALGVLREPTRAIRDAFRMSA